MIAVLLFIICLSGCQAYDYIGVASVERLNQHVEEAEVNYRDAVRNQGTIAGISYDLAYENQMDAKVSDDPEKMIRAGRLMEKAQGAVNISSELTNRNWERAPESGFDIGSILGVLAGGGGIGTVGMGLLALMNSKKAGRIKSKAIAFAHSTEKDDIASDKDFS